MLSFCPFCHSEDARIYKKNQKTRDGRYLNINQCNACLALYSSLRMDAKESFEYLSKLNTNQDDFKLDDPRRPIEEQDILMKWLKKYMRPSGNALDVGTLDGRFCFILESIGFRAYGLEPQGNAAQFARGHGLDVFSGSFPGQTPEQLQKIKFDLISFMESIYYFEDLKESLITARDMLKDKGWLLIKTHQGSSRYYNKSSFFLRFSDYVQCIPTYDFLKYSLKKTGFKVIKIAGVNPAELLPLGLGRLRGTFLGRVINKIYNLALTHAKFDIKRADRLIILAKKL